MERHDLDVLSLFSGLLFVAIAVVGLTDLVTLSLADLRWLGPLAVLAFGVVLVVTSAGGRGGANGPEHSGGADHGGADRGGADRGGADHGGADRGGASEWETQPIARDG